MRIKATLAMLMVTMFFSLAGCTGHLRNRDRVVHDPLQLPAAPKLEQMPPGTTAPGLGGSPGAMAPSAAAPGSLAPGAGGTISPLSATGPAGASVLR